MLHLRCLWEFRPSSRQYRYSKQGLQKYLFQLSLWTSSISNLLALGNPFLTFFYWWSWQPFPIHLSIHPTSENEKLLAQQENLLVPDTFYRALSKEKFYYDHLTHLCNEKRPLSCTACYNRHYLVHYHRRTLLRCCTPLYRRHRNLVRVSSGAVVMEDPSLPGLL